MQRRKKMPGPGYFWIGQEEEQEVLQVIRAGYLSRYGEESNPKFLHKVKDLESEIGKKFGSRHALAVTSGTAALITAMSAAGIGPGDEVIVPGYTFIASMSAVIFCSAVPVLAEVDESLTLDPEDVEKKITPHTRAIMAVHMLGNSCDVKKLKRIADAHKLLLIEDTCQAFGGAYRGRSLGTFGKVGAYSFNIFKTINAGDGGLLLSDDAELYKRAFAFHDQGHFPLRTGVEIGNRSVIGQNFRMNELTAAVLLAQFRKLDRMLEHLRSLKSGFKEQIRDTKGLEFRRLNDPEGDCCNVLTVFLPNRNTADKVAEKLGATTLARSGWHVYNNMEQILEMRTINPKSNPLKSEHYRGKAEYKKGMLPKTDRLLERAINISVGVVDKGLGSSFGVNLNSSSEEVDRKAETFRQVVAQCL